ncbi:hypothetical protein PTD2_02996 [Pseudoalteromonas tunicata D2]|uniref:Uncharacterized protein n=1 Tax=Pseudoalteromonas tunicata D2 TaxID=87626 RepID=A4C4M0_9GAMM|nr:hypothetical protein PTD2_02996 [Pseudoalteromonas tunicata D2]
MEIPKLANDKLQPNYLAMDQSTRGMKKYHVKVNFFVYCVV